MERDIPCACTDCVRARSLQPEVEGFDDSGVERRGDIKDESLASSSREGGWVKACGEQGLHARVLRVLPFLVIDRRVVDIYLLVSLETS